MKNFFDKLSKAADIFAEEITEGVTATKVVKLYTYDELKAAMLKNKKRYEQIKGCIISVQLRNEFEDTIFSEKKYIIRMVMLGEGQQPVCLKNSKDAYVGAVIIADSIDKKLSEFMGEKTEKKVTIKGGE